MELRHWLQSVQANQTQRGTKGQPQNRRRRHLIEPLEERSMLTADVRSLDGTGNNVANPDWGSTATELLRTAAAAYSDGMASPAGADRQSARTISNLLAAQSTDIINNRDMSAFVYAWGQFIDHDMDQTTNATPAVSFPIQVPKGDAYFDPQSTGTQTIPLNRSETDPTTGTSTANPLQQINSITAFLDGSMVYGSDPTRAAALRTFQGGTLKTSAGDLLPFNNSGLPNDNPLGAPTGSLFLAGDTRANENIELTTMQTLFMREHNRLAAQFARQHPEWSDEQIYQQARQTVIAEIQAITYNEFLPAILGRALPAYKGYDPTVNPGIANEFSTAAFRLGHSLLGTDVEFLDNQGNPTHAPTALRDDFFNPQVIEDTGIDPVLKYLASDRAQEIDTHVVDEVRNFLFGQPGDGGLDLAALNIQRGRDHGLADYNSERVAYGLPAVKTFADITKDVATQNALQTAYGNVNNIDLWVGGLAEDHLPGGSVGPLFAKILTDQFERLRDGDRFWYQREFSGSTLAQIQNTSLADIIRMNTTTTNLQSDVFFFHAAISGIVTVGGNDHGPRNSRPQGLAGILVQLEDATGSIIASTHTARDGSYAFNQLDLGSYKVQITLPAGMHQTNPAPQTIDLTRGKVISGVNFALDALTQGHFPGGTWDPRGYLPFQFGWLSQSGSGKAAI